MEQAPLKRIRESEIVLGSSAQVLSLYAPRQAHLVVTSPPYLNQREEYATYDDLQKYLKDMEDIFKGCFEILLPNGICVVNIGQDRSTDLPAHFSLLLERIGFQYVDTICWNKVGEIGTRGIFLNENKYYPNFTWEPIYVYRKMGGYARGDDRDFPVFEERFKDMILSNLRTNMWEIIPERNSWHPAPYPIKIPYYAIAAYTKAGDIVVDPFGGSGTTARACNDIGNRTYLLIERDPKYHAQSVKEQGEPSLGL